MNKIIDEIKKISGYNSETKSGPDIINNFLKNNWCTQEDLINSYEQLEMAQVPSVAFFCQLPFPILLPSQWLSTGYTGARSKYQILFNPIGAGKNILISGYPFSVKDRDGFDDEDSYINGYLPNDEQGLVLKTQVIILFELWGFRSELYNEYVNSTKKRLTPRTIIGNTKVHYSNKDGTYLTIGSYESNILSRLRPEVMKILSHIIPIYAVTCRRPIPAKIDSLYNHFIMTKGGRVINGGLGPSMITQHVREYNFKNLDENLIKFNAFWKNRNKLSQYEEYLLEAYKFLEAGHTNLAAIYSISILEWFSYEIINVYYPKILEKHMPVGALQSLILSKSFRKGNEDDLRAPLVDRFANYFPAIGICLPQKYIQELKKVKKMRNQVVHRTADTIISEKDSITVINLASDIIAYSMLKLNEQSTKSNKSVIKLQN